MYSQKTNESQTKHLKAVENNFQQYIVFNLLMSNPQSFKRAQKAQQYKTKKIGTPWNCVFLSFKHHGIAWFLGHTPSHSQFLHPSKI